MTSPWLAIVLVLAGLAAAMILVRLAGKRYGVQPEGQRKAVHIAMGFVTLSFPWLFSATWPVVLLALCAVVGLLAVRFVRPLQKTVGTVLHDVQRISFGELYFPIAVALLFILAEGKTLLYVIPLLTLTLADATAALVGERYGRHPYTTSEGHKSIEGSLAFVAVAFLSGLMPLLVLADMPLTDALAIALLVGLLVMLFEAISVGGLDNLLIPLGCYALLLRYQSLGGDQLWLRLLALVLLAIVVYGLRRSTTLKGSGLFAAVLAGYQYWMLGGWPWLAAGLVFFFSYTRIWPKNSDNSMPIHSVRAIASIVTPGLVWLLVALRNPELDAAYYCFLIGLGASMAIIGMLQLGYARPDLSLGLRVFRAVAGSWLVFLPAYFFPYLDSDLPGPDPARLLALAAVALPLLAGAAGLFLLLAKHLGNDPAGKVRWLGYGCIAFAVSFAALLITL